MSLSKRKLYTSEDYWNLPEGKRTELMDGQLYAMSPPSRVYQELVVRLSALILNHIGVHNGACKVYPAPFAVNLTANDQTWVKPDIFVIYDENKLSACWCAGVLDCKSNERNCADIFL